MQYKLEGETFQALAMLLMLATIECHFENDENMPYRKSHIRCAKKEKLPKVFFYEFWEIYKITPISNTSKFKEKKKNELACIKKTNTIKS